MPSSFRLKSGLLCAALLLTANALAESPRASAPASSTAAPTLNSTQLLAQMLLSEIALARGLLADAAYGYADLARRSGDPRIQQRANEIDLARLLVIMQQQPQEAEALLTQLLADRPAGRERLILQLPGLYARNTDKAYVLRTLQKLLQPYASLAESHFSEAIAQRDAKAQQAAYAAALRAHRLKPDWEPPLLLLADLADDSRREELGGLLEAFTQRNPGAHDVGITWVRWLLQGKQQDKARAAYARLRQTPTDRPELSFALAGVALELGELADAEALVTELLGQDWGEADRLQLILGQIQAERGNTAEALRTLDKVSPGPHYLNAQANKARLLARDKQLAQARTGLHAARQSMPEERLAFSLLEAQLLRQADEKKEAMNVLNSVLDEQPDNIEALYDSALLAEQLGQHNLMEKRLRHLIALKPEHAHALNALGYSFADRNRHLAEAEQLITRALQLAPQDPAILDSMGWLHFRQHRLEQAEANLRQAYTLFPDPEVAGHLVEVLWAAGKRDEARRLWRDSLERAPANDILTRLGKQLGL